MIYLAVTVLAWHLLTLFIVLYARSQDRKLPKQAPQRTEPWPRVSIIVPARNEEAEIEKALQSLLHLDYPNYEVIVVNDRSTDSTGAILERMQSASPQLRCVTITELPAGWLGKNHALHRGAALASGELLLFTDADIVYTPVSLHKAVAVFLEEGLDHLTLAPRVRSPSLWVNLIMASFIKNFTLFVQPWKVRDPRSRCHIGIGAFNLVRRSLYAQLGGHERIRLRPDDDLKLGKILKQAGGRQDVWNAEDELSLVYYPSLGDMIRGLEKNVLAGIDYQVSLLVLSVGILFAQVLVPWLLIVVGDPTTKVVALAALLVSIVPTALFLSQTRTPYTYAVLLPAMDLILPYIFGRSGWLTVLRRGIYWRDTFYPLSELRLNKV